MKHLIGIFLVAGVFAVAALAGPTEAVTLKAGQEKVIRSGKLRVKFQRVVEDSRCPINARCVWAGNARVRLIVSSGRDARTIELNSILSPKNVDVFGFRFQLESLDPHPGESSRKLRPTKTAVITIERIAGGTIPKMRSS